VKRICSALLAVAIVLPIPIQARSLLGVALADPIWLVQPAGDQGTELNVAEGDWVTRTALLPGGLSLLIDDAVAADGGLVYPKGEKLMLRRFGDDQAWCTIWARKIGTKGVGEPGSLGEEICFLDADRDGRFDSSVRVKGLAATGIFGAAMPHRTRTALRPTAYHPVEPRQKDLGFVVGVKFSGIYLGGAPHFTVYYGQGETATAVGKSMTMARHGRIEILGASYLILEQEKHVVKVRVERSSPAQPFQLTNGIL
jgi:hypothetical protein